MICKGKFLTILADHYSGINYNLKHLTHGKPSSSLRNKYLFFDSQVCSSLYFQIEHFKLLIHIPHSTLSALGTGALILHLQHITESLVPHSQWMFVAIILSLNSKVVSDYFVTPPTVVHQYPLSMGFSRQEYWSGLHFLLQRSFQPRDRARISCVAVHPLPLSHWGSPSECSLN